jgi:DNA-binding NtrC family response regulator
MQNDVSTVGATLAELPSSQSTSTTLQLIVLEHGRLVRCALPRSGSVRIGRSEGSEIVLNDPAASRLHAILHIGPALELEDVGSHNGTRVRNQRISRGQSVRLSIGDSIQIGHVVLLVQNAPSASCTKAFEAQLAFHAGRELIVRDQAMLSVYERAQRVAVSSINVLILGETGVGKEVVAEAIHRHSGGRSEGPFVRINCAAFPDSLVESELFGHVQGAFTGAVRDKVGLLQAAHKGTVFLDEVGELPLAIQAKLLRVIESREFTRVGGLKSQPLDVRFVAATNRNLQSEVQRGIFREDLYFRLNGVTIVVPPLRERPLEIEPLAATFAAGIAEELERPLPRFGQAALSRLREYSWPGNIRELRNVVESAVLLAVGPTIDIAQLPPPLCNEDFSSTKLGAAAFAEPQATEASTPPPGLGERQLVERERILRSLAACNGNQSRAALHLGMPRRTLVAKLVAYGIPRPRRLTPG